MAEGTGKQGIIYLMSMSKWIVEQCLKDNKMITFIKPYKRQEIGKSYDCAHIEVKEE